MNETEYLVLASDSRDGWPFQIIGVTPSYLEALEWAEQARIDGWEKAWVQPAEAGHAAA